MIDQAAHEGHAGVDLRKLDELVGFVGLRDIAGAADNGWDICALEEPRFGSV